MRFTILFGLTLALAASALTAHAAGPLYKITQPSKMTNKLGYGIINMPLSFMEVPKALNTNIKNTDFFTGTFVGLGEGIFNTGKRFCFGAFEAVTFPLPELNTLDSWVDDPIPYKELAE